MYLVSYSKGVKIKGILTVEYDLYSCTKIKRQVYCKVRELLIKVGVRLVVDFYNYERSSTNKTSYILITNRFLGYI